MQKALEPDFRKNLWSKVGRLPNANFEKIALEVFRYQAQFQPDYKEYLSYLNVRPDEIHRIEAIPFLPISLFKTHSLQTGTWEAEQVFTSSGTTSKTTSRHLVRDLKRYLKNTENGFEYFYGPVRDYAVLALLPAYLERSGSSLVAMADHFIQLSVYPESGFYLDHYDDLIQQLHKLEEQNIPTLLLGVSFALLDLAERGPFSFSNLIVMETGGMKGRRKEMTRNELHRILQAGFGVQQIHSEYGMTELFSQAYSKGNGVYYPGPTMQVFCREITDPLTLHGPGKTGVLNVVDLANLDTLSFIATEDLGRVHKGGSFEVLGRLDYSDVRGCNLLVL